MVLLRFTTWIVCVDDPARQVDEHSESTTILTHHDSRLEITLLLPNTRDEERHIADTRSNLLGFDGIGCSHDQETVPTVLPLRCHVEGDALIELHGIVAENLEPLIRRNFIRLGTRIERKCVEILEFARAGIRCAAENDDALILPIEERAKRLLTEIRMHCYRIRIVRRENRFCVGLVAVADVTPLCIENDWRFWRALVDESNDFPECSYPLYALRLEERDV